MQTPTPRTLALLRGADPVALRRDHDELIQVIRVLDQDSLQILDADID